MHNLIIQPSGNKDARTHYVDTIKNRISFETASNFLDQKILNQLQLLYPKKEFPAWGVTQGEKSVNKNKWKKIEPGDIAVFTREGFIIATGIVTIKFQSYNFAKYLWDFDAKGNTWEFMFLLDDIRPQKIPYIEFNNCIGDRPKNRHQGFRIVYDEQKVNAFMDTFGIESNYYPDNEDEVDTNWGDELDGVSSAPTRKEQAIFRKKLFAGKQVHKCGICNKEYPVSFLWTGHIKKRSRCNNSEKRDFNIVMPMCKFGCDDLYEKGFIGVLNGKVEGLKQSSSKTINNYINNIVGNDCSYWSDKTKGYFEWHSEEFSRSIN